MENGNGGCAIRKMTAGDYGGAYQLWLNTPGMGLNASDGSKAGIEKYLRRNPNTSFVAEKDGKIIGTVLSGHDGRRGFINHTAVAASERARGIGSALVERAMEALEEEGINKVALVALESNKIGNAFWENRGFTIREDLVYRNRNIKPLARIGGYIGNEQKQ